jgi:hypothetical protein
VLGILSSPRKEVNAHRIYALARADNEGLGWLRSPFRDSVLLLKGDSVQVDCNCAEVKNTKDLTLKGINKFKVIVSVSAFYSKIEEEWYQITEIMNKLWHRTHWKKG